MSITETKPAPHKTIVDAMLILVRDDRILLAERQSTGYADGMWNVPSGKLEAGETVSHAAVREGREEIGVPLNEADLHFVHLAHYRNHLGDARLGVFFQALNWKGEPYNAEPDKCSRIAWWPINGLPDNTYPYTAEGVRAYLRGEPFKNVGWKD
jgi:8-oxo-dGTP diphosphatase